MKILIIDDERAIRNSLKEILCDEGYETDAAENGIEGLQMAAENQYDLIFCDIKMPRMDGVEVLEKLIEDRTRSAVVMISGHADINTAVSCIKKGAYDFIEKPLELNRILITVKNVIEKASLIKQTVVLKQKAFGSEYSEMIGSSKEINHIRYMIDKVAGTDARVLITGSNGVGKEIVARMLHENSLRSSMPYIDVNCAAIPSELIESELFGHEKGAFTSAVKQHKGKFEQADGGTLFLDEVGDLSLAAQAKMLRVLQEKKLSRVGSDKDIKVDVRVIAATNKNLREEISAGRFREDLYHRLSVIVLNVPDLDDRKEDIPELVKYFVGKISAESALKPREFSAEAMEMLQNRNWKGNVRELRNVVERLMILGHDTIIPQDITDFVL